MTEVQQDRRRSAAKKGTVCPACWGAWSAPRHKVGTCKDVWDDPDSPNGLTVCMCGCASNGGLTKRSSRD